MPDNPLDNPLLHEQVERALEPYKALLPADILEEFRAMLAVTLATHPTTRRMLERLRPPPVVDASTSLERHGAPDTGATKDAGQTRAGGDRS